MNRKTAAGIMIALAAMACDRPGKTDKGMGAGADTLGIRDTAMTTPAPAPVPTDSLKDSAQQHSSATQPKNQTQSGMKNKAGQSTLGPAVRRTRPDANEPVTAKGDTLSRSVDQQATDSLNRAVLERLSGKNDSASINGEHDTMPQPVQPIPVPPVPTDSVKPVPTDSTKPVPTDSLKPIPTDSTRTPPPLPLDTIRPMRDSTARDTTKH